MLRYLLILLVSIGPAFAGDNFDEDLEICPRVGAAVFHETMDRYFDGIDGKTFVGNNGQKYRLLTRSIDRSPAKLDSIFFEGSDTALRYAGRQVTWRQIPHNVEVVNEQGVIVGYADLSMEVNMVRLNLIQVRGEEKKNGLATAILAPLAANLPPGLPMRLFSGEPATNAHFENLATIARSSKEYTEAVRLGGQRGGDAYLSEMLTRDLQENQNSEVAWAKVLRKAGFKNLTVEMKSFTGPIAIETYYLYATPSEASMGVNHFLNQVDGTPVQAKNGETYTVRTRSIDVSPAKMNSQVFAGTPSAIKLFGRPLTWSSAPHNVEVVDKNGAVVGFMNALPSSTGVDLSLIEIRKDLRNQGLAKAMLVPMAKSLPKGTPVHLASSEENTNIYLQELCELTLQLPEFKQARARGRLEAEKVLSDSLTKMVKDRPGERGALWPNLLRDSGFKNIRVEVRYVDEDLDFFSYSIVAEP